MKLVDLHILALDCQATAAHGAGGLLLELGWATGAAGHPAEHYHATVESHCVSLPDEAVIPTAVQRVTGLSRALMAGARPAAGAWESLRDTARTIADVDQLDRCPTIIHCARFEEPFLRELHVNGTAPSAFPLRLICTLDIARRLLPGLPRRGLRALAGFFGHPVPPLRRSREHAIATALIWQDLVRRLADEHRIEYLDHLCDWLGSTSANPRSGRIYPMPAEARRNLPARPGVYCFRRSNGDPLYVGKAASLKQRVGSYFRAGSKHAEHILEMLCQAADVGVTPTDTALEAALLECDEIQHQAPPYNIALHPQGRRPLYFSRDLASQAAVPDRIHCIGPLSEGRLSGALVAWGQWLRPSLQRDHPDALLRLGNALLGVSGVDGPDRQCLEQGLVRFLQKWMLRVRDAVPLRALTAIGRALWEEHLAARHSAKAQVSHNSGGNDVEDAPAEDFVDPVWQPETVTRRIEGVALQGGLRIRRARWFQVLGRSTLVWEMRKSRTPAKRLLRFDNGRVTLRATLCGADTPYDPSFLAGPVRGPLQFLDLWTYDRLRVVTTELRRIMAEDRFLEIRLGSRSALTRHQLAKLLLWV